jgi:hypothetical protein
MKRSGYTEEQNIATLSEVDAGAKVQGIVWRLGVTEQPYWMVKFGGDGRSATPRSYGRSRRGRLADLGAERGRTDAVINREARVRMVGREMKRIGLVSVGI